MKKTLFVLIFFILLINYTMAFEFDNVKSYNSNTKEVTITNALGLGDVIGKAKLNTPINNMVGIGYQKVAEFDIWAYEDYNEAIKQFTFTDIKTKQKINREFDLKYLTEEEYAVEDKETIIDEELSNGTIIYKTIVTGQHIETREIWKKITPASLKKDEKLTIGIFTNVLVGDYVDWIPTIYGVEIEEWATWTASLDVDLVNYYGFDETSGDAIDFIGSNNGNTSNIIYSETGKIATAFGFGGNAYVNLGADYLETETAGSISMWLKQPNITMNNRLISSSTSESGGSNILQLFISNTGKPYVQQYKTGVGSLNDALTGNMTILPNEWVHVVWTSNGTEWKVYVNGSINNLSIDAGSNTGNWFGDLPAGSHNFEIGRVYQDPAFSYFSGQIDEVGIWNRELTAEEVVQLYNEGNGINMIPYITLNSPDNETFELVNNNINFNISSSGDNLQNISLYIDGTLNETKNITGSTNNSIFNKTFATIGNYTWYVKVCRDLYCDLSENRSLIIEKLRENSFTFSNTTQIGSQEDFEVNLTLANGYSVVSANFYYNYTEVTPEIYTTGNNIRLVINNYAIPLYSSNQNATIFFNIQLNDGTIINTTQHIQQIYTFLLDNCTSYSYKLFDINLYDEEDKSVLLGDIEFNYKLLNIPSYSEISSLNMSFTNISSQNICSEINLTDSGFVHSIEIRYLSEDYEPELYHIQRGSIEEGGTTIDLFDLKTNTSTEFKITYQNNNFNFIGDAIVQLMRKYISEDSYEIVEAPLTSSDGITNLHVDLNSIKYKIIVIKNGIILDTFDNIVFKCDSPLTGDCEQKLLGVIDPGNDISIDKLRDISYIITHGNGTISVSFSILSGISSNVSIILEQKDLFGNETICNETLYSSSGSLECSYSKTIGDSYLILKIYKDDQIIAIKSYIVPEENGFNFLNNNYFIVIILLLSLAGMAITSPEWIIINSIITLLIAGSLFLINGVSFVMGFGSLVWLVIAAAILIFKIAKQEDR